MYVFFNRIKSDYYVMYTDITTYYEQTKLESHENEKTYLYSHVF